ncbi:GNAT family N-acetyltransferase [Kitasatospora sp. NPDC088783]|uniref:GNAT family N-acetyltransferase n=1 Tax=Kitasatospora sp. NPDC088783 TaxID=3364077 RepID=UPI00382DCC75
MTSPLTADIHWHTRLQDAPADSRTPGHPSRTRQWATAWQAVTTEKVLHHRHATITADVHTETVSFYLVPPNGSPYWASQEADAGMEPIWPGPVLYAGSPHAQYNGAGTTGAAMAAATVHAGTALAKELDACAVVHPGLRPHQATALTRAANGQLVHTLDLATDVAHTRHLGRTFDDWWAGMPNSTRREARRIWRRGTEEGLILEAATGQAIHPLATQFAALANTTADRHGTRLYGADHFHVLADVPGAVLLQARQNDELVGGLYGWLYRGTLSLWASGIDYRHPCARRTYTWLLSEAARWAITSGADRIDAGRANYRAKAGFGFHPDVLRTVAHLADDMPQLQAQLVELSHRLGEQAKPYLGTQRW